MPAFAVLISYLVRCHWTTRVLILCPLFFHTLNKTKTLMQRSKGTKEKRNGVKDFCLLHQTNLLLLLELQRKSPAWITVLVTPEEVASMDHSPKDIPVTRTEYNDLNLRYTELKSDHVNLQEKYQQLRDENERLKEELKKSTFSYSNIKCNMVQLLFITGITSVLFDWLCTKIAGSVKIFSNKLSLQDHLLIVLMKLRLQLMVPPFTFQLSPKANSNFLHRRSTHQDNCHVSGYMSNVL
ncbi:uncharacterized protein LOC133418597 isoform X2 [Cololabis saira]|uniref:uncharacterized protein LOC133418597 isoform X2 n=1 Tax=Cololabis saira TaxID=129043 RepID=UPI002AD35194|nr:uncharacterized protein LOC133418597 isoform X2 [Cololabis saira]